MPSIAYRKLRRLAPRTKRVLERRGGADPAIAAYVPSLAPKADDFIKGYDAAAKYEATWRREMREGRGAIAAVLKAVRSWVPLLARDIDGLDLASFGDQPDVPDDVLADAERLLSVVEEAGANLAFADAARTALGASYEAALKEWHEAEKADSTYQQLLARVRETGASFDSELQLFRRTLASALGRSDKDYQKLRAERASAADEEDDPGAPPPAEPLKKAPPGQKEPTE